MVDALNKALTLAILEESPLGVVVWNRDGRLRWVNPTVMELFRLPAVPEAAEEELHSAILPPAEDDEAQGLVHLTEEDGRERWLLRMVFELRGEHRGLRVGLFLDQGELCSSGVEDSRFARQLWQHIATDRETGLMNERALMFALEPLVSRSRRYGNPLSLITLSLELPLDNEWALVAVSRLLKDQLRWADMVGRLDSGDFLLLLPETTGQDAWILANKLLKEVGGERFDGVHLGVTQWQVGDSAQSLLDRVGEAVAQARLNAVSVQQV